MTRRWAYLVAKAVRDRLVAAGVAAVMGVTFALVMPTYARQDNTNLWPFHRDAQMGFLLSYPPDWSVRPGQGRTFDSPFIHLMDQATAFSLLLHM